MGAKKKGRKNPPPEPDRPVGERELVFVAKADAAAAPATADDVQEVLDRAGATAAPVFETGAMAAAADAGADELAGYYRVEADEDALDDLREELCRCGAVETAYVKPPVEPAVATLDRPEEEVARTAPAATPDFTPRQGYLNRAPAGVDARYAWTLPGGSGAGVQIIDIEGAWNFSHEDLRANQGGVVGGTPTSDPGWRNHGTAVIGEYGGDRNNFGVTGICPDA